MLSFEKKEAKQKNVPVSINYAFDGNRPVSLSFFRCGGAHLICLLSSGPTLRSLKQSMAVTSDENPERAALSRSLSPHVLPARVVSPGLFRRRYGMATDPRTWVCGLYSQRGATRPLSDLRSWLLLCVPLARDFALYCGPGSYKYLPLRPLSRLSISPPLSPRSVLPQSTHPHCIISCLLILVTSSPPNIVPVRHRTSSSHHACILTNLVSQSGNLHTSLNSTTSSRIPASCGS